MFDQCGRVSGSASGFFENSLFLHAGGRYFVAPRVALFAEAANNAVPFSLGGTLVLKRGR